MKVNFHLELKPIKAEAVSFDGGTLDVSTEMNLDEMKQYTDTLFKLMEVFPAYMDKLNDLGPMVKVETPDHKFQFGGVKPPDNC